LRTSAHSAPGAVLWLGETLGPPGLFVCCTVDIFYYLSSASNSPSEVPHLRRSCHSTPGPSLAGSQ
jgi:hypothetical protein